MTAPFTFRRPEADLTGMHNAVIEAAEGKLSTNGNLQISARLRLENRASVFINITFTEAAAGIVTNFFDAVWGSTERLEDQSFDPQSNADLAFVKELAADLVNETLSVKIAMVPDYRGEFDEDGQVRPMQPKVKGYYPYGTAKNVASMVDNDDSLL